MSYRPSDRTKSHHYLDRTVDSDTDWNAGGSEPDSKLLDKPQKEFESDPRKTLFIGRLSPTTTEDDLRKYFERFGDIRSLTLIRDILTGDSRRYAFCEYRRSKDADNAYAGAHNAIIDGRRILVDREFGRTMKGWKPRRIGGGFGGFKESGQVRFGGRQQPYGGPGGSDDGHYSGGYRPRPHYQANGRGGAYGSHFGSHHHSGGHSYPSNGYHSSGGSTYSSRGPPRSNEFGDSLRSRMHGSNSGGCGNYRQPSAGPMRSTTTRR